MKRIILFDNYDSFTHNLLHLLQKVRPDYAIEVIRNRNIEVLKMVPDALIVGPGPMTPSDTGILTTYFNQVIEPEPVPVLGVCLGLHFIGYCENVPVNRSVEAVHGAAVRIHHTNDDIFSDAEENFLGARYNSLEIQCVDIEKNAKLKILARETSTNSV